MLRADRGRAREVAAGDLLELGDEQGPHGPRQRREALTGVVCDDHLSRLSSSY